MKVHSLFLTIALLVLVSTDAFAQGDFGPETRLTDVIVKVEPGALQLPPQVPGAAIGAVTIRVPELANVLSQHGATHVMRSFPGASPADTVLVSELGHQIRLIDRTRVFRFRFPTHAPLDVIAEQLSEAPGILFAYRIPQYSLAIIPQLSGNQGDPLARPPNDPELGPRQWNLRHTGQGFQPPVTDGGRADIRAFEAWNLFNGSPDVRIGIIDTGMLLTHEDLSGKVTGDPQATTGDSVYDSHGSHVGGIAGALTHNSKGIAGVDWHAQLISRNIDPFSPEVIYDRIISAANAGAHILNNSWGTVLGDVGTDHLVRLAFASVHNANILPIAATHNWWAEATAYPSGFWEVMAVGSSNHLNRRSDFSNWGSHLEVVAPGGLGLPLNRSENIYSTWATSNTAYHYAPGTSQAAPHVAGLASLIRGYAQQQHGITLFHDDLRQIIRRTADQIRPNEYQYNADGWNAQVGFGRIDAYEALLMVRDNDIVHGSEVGGDVHGSSDQYLMQIHGAPGLASTTYAVRRHEVRRTVTYNYTENLNVWARSLDFVKGTGMSGESPNYAKHWAEVIPSSVTPSSATLRTFVYEVWNLNGQYLGYWPTTPSNVRFAYTVLGDIGAPPPPPPLTIELSGEACVHPFSWGQWTATASGGTGSSYTFEWWKEHPQGAYPPQLLKTTSTTSNSDGLIHNSDHRFELRVDVTRGQDFAQDIMLVEVSSMCPIQDAEDELVADADDAQSLEHGAAERPSGDTGDPAFGIPQSFSLDGAYPNPFSRSTSVSFSLPEASNVTLVVHDALGREVTRIEESYVPTGAHTLLIHADGWPNGTYVYRIEAVGVESGAQFVDTRRMTLVR